MKGKILFVVGLGVGYVLGARAGRERYEQIRKAAEDVWNQPKVQEGVQTVKDFAMSRAGDVGETVLDGAKKLVSQVTSQTSSTKRSPTSGSSGSSKSSANGSPGVKPTASASRPSTSSAKTGSGAKSTGTSSSSNSSSSNPSSS